MPGTATHRYLWAPSMPDLNRRGTSPAESPDGPPEIVPSTSRLKVNVTAVCELGMADFLLDSDRIIHCVGAVGYSGVGAALNPLAAESGRVRNGRWLPPR